jgi:hypothetical protein
MKPEIKERVGGRPHGIEEAKKKSVAKYLPVLIIFV